MRINASYLVYSLQVTRFQCKNSLQVTGGCGQANIWCLYLKCPYLVPGKYYIAWLHDSTTNILSSNKSTLFQENILHSPGQREHAVEDVESCRREAGSARPGPERGHNQWETSRHWRRGLPLASAQTLLITILLRCDVFTNLLHPNLKASGQNLPSVKSFYSLSL